MIKMIAACSMNGVIGANNDLPWKHDYPEDLKFFRKMTLNQTVIMGRKTYDSIGRALPKRKNLIVSFEPCKIDGAETCTSYEEAALLADNDAWVIGGASAYGWGLSVAGQIYITTIPQIITGNGLIYFPYVNPHQFKLTSTTIISAEKKLICSLWERIDPLI